MGEPQINEVRNELASFQVDFCDTSTPNVKTIIGAKGSGKTWIGARFIAKMVDELPGSKGIFACSTNQQAEDIWVQDIQSLLDDLNWQYQWNKVKGQVTFANGTVMHIRTAERPERIESIQYDWGWQDEVSLASKEFCQTINSRIRGIEGAGHKRFTSMPDDPEHFIYEYLEDISDSFHEVTLSDNPDKKFVAAYTENLKAIYSGAELERYLNAKRVSLAGLGLFNIKNDHRKTVDYDPSKDLYFCWDFNVIYRAVTAWQIVGKTEQGYPLLGCVDAYQMDEATTYEDAQELAKYWAPHQQRVFLHGDASGDNRTASTSDTMWQQVKKGFKEQFENQVRYIVPRANPNVKDTIQILNWALTNDLILFDPKASVAFRSVSAAKADKYGEIDKSNDDSPDGANTHEMDTVRYMAHHVFEKHLPGSGSKSSITKLKGT